MATTPPLHGLRIIECSALGPAAITTSLVDLGADVIKVEPPAGDYIREMTWPIVEGVSLMHLHLNRGKRSIVLDLRTDAGTAIFKELATGADVVIEAMRPGSLARRGVGFDDLKALNPEDRVLHDLGLRDDRPLPRLPEPRHRLRHLGRHRQRGHRRRRVRLHPRARVDRHQRRAALRRAWASSPRSSGPATPAKAPTSTWPSPTRRPPSTGTAPRPGGPTSGPQSEVTGNKSDDYERRAPGTAGMVEGVRYQVYESADGAHVLFMASEQAFWKNFCEGVGRMDLFERWPGSKYADHARGQPRAPQRAARHLPDQDRAASGSTSVVR